MMRSFHQFACSEETLSGTLDQGDKSTGLLIVSGGNEIKAGAHAGMAKLAQTIAAQGFPVFRYDRRGIGESSGTNHEFLGSEADIFTAAQYFRQATPHVDKVIAFGNCDAATALALFGKEAPINGFLLANPWAIETADNSASDAPTVPPPSAIRSRYWERLKNPQSLIDLFTGKIDLRKLASGLKQATQKQENTGLSMRLKDGLESINKPCRILLANKDTTARAFLAAWNSKDFAATRALPNITSESIDSASHSFADDRSKKWLESQILETLNRTLLFSR
ncbi:MAG: hydrolase 1, exosortase A system-associated [Parasphingorhabdus sp.]|uniref:hydrolase 1, exosortase A system-associated n=1 Tax=Parasphingorhabdus sp. TaxID=2709688 RepID=UPI003002DBDE